jgi:hypothetical protein
MNKNVTSFRIEKQNLIIIKKPYLNLKINTTEMFLEYVGIREPHKPT